MTTPARLINFKPYEPEIDHQAPFSNDKCGFEPFGLMLTSILSQAADGIVIAVDAPWGQGKSTFARMWTESIKKEKKLKDVILFNAFQHDSHSDPFVPLAAEVLSIVKQQGGKNHGKLKKSAQAVLQSIAMQIPGMVMRNLTVKMLGEKGSDELTEQLSEAVQQSADMFAASLLESYDEEKSAVEKFIHILQESASAYRTEHGFPLLVVVDELDRCRPDFALRLIERMKHIFAVDGVAFVLMTNTDQLGCYVHKEYGMAANSEEYLRKFFTVTLPLPRPKRICAPHESDKYISTVLEHHGISEMVYVRRVEAWFRYFDFTLREIDRCCQQLALVFVTSNRTRHDGVVELMVLFVLMKHKAPKSLKTLLEGTTSFKGLRPLLDIHGEKPLGQDAAKLADFVGISEYDEALDFLLNPDAVVQTNKNWILQMLQHYRNSGMDLVRWINDRINLVP